MFQRQIIVGLFTLLSTQSFSAMVSMREDSKSKHIVYSKNHKDFKKITKGSDWHLYPDISADGDKVVYVKGKDQDNLAIVVHNLRTKKKEKWDFGSGRVLHPRFSRDGRQLAFSIADQNGKHQIGFVNLAEKRRTSYSYERDGFTNYSVEPTIIKDDAQSFFPSFTSDNQFLVYQRSSKENGREIVQYSFYDKKVKFITKGMAPSISFDDQYLAFTNKVDDNWNIYILHRRNGQMKMVTEHAKQDFAPTFNHHGDLIFASDRQGDFGIYKISNDHWSKEIKEVKKVLRKNRVAYYAPKISGDVNFEQDLLKKFPSEARSSFGTIVHDDILYIVGGHKGHEHTYPPESFSDETWSYNLKTKKWKKLAPRLHKAHGFQIVAHNDYIYAFGGFAYSADHRPRWKSLSVVERYDVKNDVWEVIGNMPNKRSSNVALKVFNKVYIIGGWNSTPKFENDYDGHFHEDIDVFDLDDESFSTLATQLKAPKRRAFTGFTYKSKIYLVGGLGEGATHFELLNNVTEFDPITEEFKELAPLPFATFAPAAYFLKDSFYVFGGMFKTGKMEYLYVPHIYRHQFGSNEWNHTGRFLTEDKGFSMVVPYKKELLVIGGHSYKDEKDAPVKTIESFKVHRRK